MLGRSAPSLVDAWRSRIVAQLGRAALVVVAVMSGAGLIRDGADILS
jgi:hypothetical protein